jgi:hypothetical protein
MILCGMALDLCGKWRVEQLTTELQDIINKYPQYFSEDPVPPMRGTPDEDEDDYDDEYDDDE